MDEFGVLTERYGLKPQGKSAPMSQAKRSSATATATATAIATATTDRNFEFESGLTRNSTSFSSKSSLNSSASNGSLLDDHDFFPKQNSQNSFAFGDDYGYEFGGFENPTRKQSNTSNNSSNGSSFDLTSMFLNSGLKSSSTNSYVVDDLFGGMHSSQNASNDNNFGSFASSTKPKGSVGDLLGDFSGVAAKLKSSSRNGSWDSGTNEAGVDDDLFGGMPGSQNASNDNNFGSFSSSTKPKGSVGDLLGDFSGVAAKLKSSSRNGSWDSGTNEAGVDDLIPGFGGSSLPVNRINVKATKSTFKSTEEPFVVLESDSGSEYHSSKAPTEPLEEFSMFNQSGGTKPRGSSNTFSSLRPPPKPAQVLKADKGSSASFSKNKVKSSGASPIDGLEDFAMGRVHNKANRSKEAEDAAKKTQQNIEDDLESFFGVSSRSNSAPKSRATTLDPMFDANIHNRQQKTSAGASSTAKKASSATTTNRIDDLSFIFGAAPMFGEFEEVSGESEERRRARLERHQRTQDRMARAVADMNQRDRQTQNEQEERHRIAKAMDFEIKRWAAGKEGNMRALLSSLQLVLWSECGWEPVSLTDLITTGSVKKVYRKASLCVHPDKVQQKGATLEQKYIAEKVFDILKEAWNKFNKEELS